MYIIRFCTFHQIYHSFTIVLKEVKKQFVILVSEIIMISLDILVSILIVNYAFGWVKNHESDQHN